MANHQLPTLTSTYSNFVSEMSGRFNDIALGLDPAVTSATNVPTNSIRWNSVGTKWEKYSGTAWNDLATTYTINISGNSATATKLLNTRTINGVNFDGTQNINVNTNNSITFNSSGLGGASGSTFNGNSAITVSYNTIGAPSTTGDGASGSSWPIGITGNAATASQVGGSLPNTFTAVQTFSGTSSNVSMVITDAAEAVTISNTGLTGTLNYNVTSQSVLFHTVAATGNWTLNLRGSVGTTLNTLMTSGQSITVVVLATQGGTAYFNSAVQIDGTTAGVTTRWQGGSAPANGNVNGVDIYSYTIIKTAPGTFSVFAAQARFA